jgi:dihydroxy-acid dehydratase
VQHQPARIAKFVKDGIRAAGGTPQELNTISISDGVTMGTEGMKSSLISREVIADSVELVARGHMFDALVGIGACDKTLPGLAIALARLDIPGVLVYSGSILPGEWNGNEATIRAVYEAIGANAAGKMSDEDLRALEDAACPGAGACGGQYTANTMAMAMEFIGLSPMGSASPPAVDPRKEEVGQKAGELIMDVLRRGVRPSDILTREAFENAIGRRRHLWRLDQRGSPPAGAGPRGWGAADDRRLRRDLPADPALLRHDARRQVRRRRPRQSGWHGRRRQAPGRWWPGSQRRDDRHRPYLCEEAADAVRNTGSDVVHQLGDPLNDSGGLVILKGNIAPDGAVVKLFGYERTQHRGPARVFDSEHAAHEAVQHRQIVDGDVGRHPLRRAGRRPGHAGDARGDGGAGRPGVGRHGCAHHRWPVQRRDQGPDDRPRRARSRRRRPLAAVYEGDTIVIDIDKRRLDVELSPDEIQQRLATWAPPTSVYQRGVLAKYRALVTQANDGAVTRLEL